MSPARRVLSTSLMLCFSKMNRNSFHTTSSSTVEFREVLARSRNIVFLTGAGVSAESGIPTFRGAGGLWRTFVAQDLATPLAFRRNPSLVWEFYSYRREVVLNKKPNKAHTAIAEFQDRMLADGRNVSVITQNVDGFHQLAGTKDVIELHVCICCTLQSHFHALTAVKLVFGKPLGPGAPDPNTPDACIPELALPRCSQPCCDSLVRPAVVWFGESLDPNVLAKTDKILAKCDVCLLIGTSSVVYPAAGFAPMLAARGVPVAEFNLEETPATGEFRFHFHGPAGETLPPILAPL